MTIAYVTATDVQRAVAHAMRDTSRWFDMCDVRGELLGMARRSDTMYDNMIADELALLVRDGVLRTITTPQRWFPLPARAATPSMDARPPVLTQAQMAAQVLALLPTTAERETIAADVFGTDAETIGDALGAHYVARLVTLSSYARRLIERLQPTEDEQNTHHTEDLTTSAELANVVAMLSDVVRAHATLRGVLGGAS